MQTVFAVAVAALVLASTTASACINLSSSYRTPTASDQQKTEPTSAAGSHAQIRTFTASIDADDVERLRGCLSVVCKDKRIGRNFESTLPPIRPRD